MGSKGVSRAGAGIGVGVDFNGAPDMSRHEVQFVFMFLLN